MGLLLLLLLWPASNQRLFPVDVGGDQVIAAGIAAIPREIQFNERTRGKTWNGFIDLSDSRRRNFCRIRVNLHRNMQQRESSKFLSNEFRNISEVFIVYVRLVADSKCWFFFLSKWCEYFYFLNFVNRVLKYYCRWILKFSKFWGTKIRVVCT